MLGRTWDKDFELPDGSYFISEIQSYFGSILKKHETLTDEPPTQNMSTEFRTKLYSRLNLGIILSS